MPRQIDLNDVRLLMQVIEQGSFTAASRATGIPKSTISQRIAALERTMGTGLLRRTSRSFSLTEAGRELLPHARAIDDLARTVENSIMEQGRELHGTLRISASKVLAQFCLCPLVFAFLEKHDQVRIRVEATNQMADLVNDGLDMMLRGHVGPLKDSNLIQRVVARARWVLAASPDWVARHGAPATPDDIPQGEVLYFTTSTDSTTDCTTWTLQSDGKERILELQPRLVSDDMVMLRDLAISGSGVICLPAYILKNAFRSKTLVILLSDWTCQTSTISVLTPPRAQSSRLASAFSDFLAAEMPALVQS